MKITIMFEGQTEKAFLPNLKSFLTGRVPLMPKLDPFICNGRIYKEDKLRRTVASLLGGHAPSDAVIALTDVYTGTNDFVSAADAKAKMRAWVGPNDKFYPHAAQHDFEAWLLPYWPVIQTIARHNKSAPSGPPESVNHNRPPSERIKEIFNIGACQRDYSKVRDAARILRDQDLGVAASSCPELKAFLNTILTLSGGQPL